MNKDEKKLKKLLSFNDDSALAIFDELDEANEHLSDLDKLFKGADFSKLEFLQGEKGDKGDPGEKGERGDQGPIGKTGKDGKNGTDGIDGIDGKNGKDGRDGKDGKDGSPDTAQDIKKKLESLTGDFRLDASAIKNLPKLAEKLAKDGYPMGWPQPAGALTYRLNGAQVGRGNILNLQAGSGVSITSVPGPDSLTYLISATGGGTIGGSINTSQVGYGSALNTLTSNADFTYVQSVGGAGGQLSVGVINVWSKRAVPGQPVSEWYGEQAGNNGEIGNGGGQTGANVGFGGFTGHEIVEGYFNSMFGREAGSKISTGFQNTLLGHFAGKLLTTGSNNVMIGESAGISTTGVARSVFIGANTGTATSANECVFIGHEAGNAHTTGLRSVFIGYRAGFVNSTTGDLTAVGYGAGAANVGNQNTFLGTFAGTANDSGIQNTYIGTYAGQIATSGIKNVYLGYGAGINTTTASGNVYLGSDSGTTISTGGNNTFVGLLADGATSSTNSAIAIGSGAKADSHQAVIGGDSNGAYIDILYIGSNAFDASPIPNVTLSATSATGGSNASGTDLVLTGGSKDGAGFNGRVQVVSRFLLNIGTGSVASSVTLSDQGNTFFISGSGTINNISLTGWQAGAWIILEFSDATTLTHSAGGAGQLILDGSTTFNASAGDRVMFYTDGNDWKEISRSVV